MKDIIDYLTNFHKGAPPFIKENNDGTYSLVGNSDLASGKNINYLDFGDHKLTAKNHSNTLLKLMAFISILDAMDEQDLDFYEEENQLFLNQLLGEVLSAFFSKKVEFREDIFWMFLKNNKHIINEALYNLTRDKEQKKPINYQDIVDGLEGSQFNDPYVGIAYEIARKFKKRPHEIIEDWSTSELIVLFAKMVNDSSQETFIQWKYNQPKSPKPKKPVKQKFFFEEVEVQEENEEDENYQ